MTKRQWEILAGTTIDEVQPGRWCTIYYSDAPMYDGLFNLEDFIVQSVSGATVWLVPRPKEGSGA
jgi:hypothetical protein